MKSCHIGIDLGTTNSSCALFDGNAFQVARNSEGSHLTPSVVHVYANGRTSTGHKAKQYPANSKTGFKRLMGTDQQFVFAASGRTKSPVELSAAIIDGWSL